MATLLVKDVIKTGLNPNSPVYVSCAEGGDEAANNDYTFLHVVNGHSGALEVTVNSVKACDQGFDHDVVVSVPAGEERMIGPFDRGRFNDSAGKIQITYDAVTALTIAAIKVSP